MSNQPLTMHLEIPPEVRKQEVWDLDEQVRQVAGITTDLREPKDPVTETILYITLAFTVVEGINAIHDLAQHIYDFLHLKKQEADQQQGKNKVVIVTKGKRIELYNLSLEEIKQILKS